MAEDENVTAVTRPSRDGDAPDSPCVGCSVGDSGRRAFLQSAAAAVAAVLGLALAPSLARAIPVEWDGDDTTADQRRYPIPVADGVSVDEGSSVILARTAGSVYAFSLSCPHKRTPLGWQPARNRFECPKHKSKYQPDGVFISGRATRSMDRYAIRREGAQVVVELQQLYREDRDAAAWRAAVVKL